MLALPWMESLARGASGMVSPQRAAFYYVPIRGCSSDLFPREDNGVVPKFNNDNFDAEQTQSAIPIGIHPLELTQTMRPLHRVKDKVTLITGMDRTFQPGTDVHAQCVVLFPLQPVPSA